MIPSIPNMDMVKRLWNKWDIRCIILSSLSLQIILILVAPLRKRTSRIVVVWMLWSAYLLADCAAIYCIGLISHRKGSSSSSSSTTTTTDINDCLMAFWAPFLLLHLGGPDTITAFAVEDNELWLRHLLGVVVQVGAVVYVFILTLPGNPLWIPTVLVFIAGIIKYSERTRALYLASMGSFRKSMAQELDPGPNYAKLMNVYSSRKKAGLPARIAVIEEPASRSRASHESMSLSSSLQEENNFGEHVKLVRDGYFFFDKFKGLIVDMIYSWGDRNESRQYFLDDKKFAEVVLQVIEIELNFMYEFFYTKTSVLHDTKGCVFRFVAFCSTVGALVVFIVEKKRGFDQFDLRVTYTLLYGAVVLDFLALLTLLYSDRTVVFSSHQSQRSFQKVFGKIRGFIISSVVIKKFLQFRNYLLCRKKPQFSPCKMPPNDNKYDALSTPVLFRRWSGTISGFNLIRYCLHSCSQHPSEIDSRCRVLWLKLKAMLFSEDAFYRVMINYFGFKDILDKLLYEDRNPFLKNLWELIFAEVRDKAKSTTDTEIEEICNARGERVLKQNPDLEGKLRENLMPFIDSHEVSFDQSLILWHIATHLCYHQDTNLKDPHACRQISRILADYMLYLLVLEPSVLSGVIGIGLKRFRDTCAEAMRFFSEREAEVEEQPSGSSKIGREDQRLACEKLLEVCTDVKPTQVKGDRSKSVLFDACRLAKELNKVEKRWELISKIWVELLSFAASNCRPIALVSQLNKGGELLSLVWLLMVQMGLGKQFQIKKGHARAKIDRG